MQVQKNLNLVTYCDGCGKEIKEKQKKKMIKKYNGYSTLHFHKNKCLKRYQKGDSPVLITYTG